MDEDFDNWLENAPVANLGATGDFEIWLDEAPVVESGGPGTTPTPPRRRAHLV